MWNWFKRWLASHIEFSTEESAAVAELSIARARAAVMAERLPTFDNIAGCMDCHVIQAHPQDGRCVLCRQEQIVNLVMQLRRGSQRIGKRKQELRRVGS